MAHLAVDADVAPGLFQQSVHHAEPEARAFPLRLGREERFKGTIAHFRRHPDARIADFDHRVPTGFDVWKSSCIVRIGAKCARRDPQRAALGHCVARVDHEVEYRVFELSRVDQDVTGIRIEAELDCERAGECSAQHAFHALDQCVDGHDLGREHLPARERQQPLTELCAAPGGVHRVFHEIGGVFPAHLPREQLEIAEHDRQQVVEIVRNASGQLTERLHALELDDLLAQRAPFRHVRDEALQYHGTLVRDWPAPLPNVPFLAVRRRDPVLELELSATRNGCLELAERLLPIILMNEIGVRDEPVALQRPRLVSR